MSLIIVSNIRKGKYRPATTTATTTTCIACSYYWKSKRMAFFLVTKKYLKKIWILEKKGIFMIFAIFQIFGFV